MTGTKRQHPCIEFALMDASDPRQVARFIYWLVEGRWPEEKIDLSFLDSGKELTAEEIHDSFWGLEAPRGRMAKLLWKLLQQEDSEAYFHNQFTVGMPELIEDATGCAELLAPIQQRLRWVLEGVEAVDRRDQEVNQGAWGEEWFLPTQQARFVREQLRRAHLDLIEQTSEYEDALEAGLRYLATEHAKFIDIPVPAADRVYIGEHVKSSMGHRMWVWVEGGGQRQGLVSARNPWHDPPGDQFGWGYPGSGSKHLAESLLADATDGDLEVAQCYGDRFWEVVEALPMRDEFQLTRGEILAWLERQGVGAEELRTYQAELRRRRQTYGPILERRARVLKAARADGGLRAQRFACVPEDFESALYVDLMEMLQQGGRIMRCGRCGLPVPYDGSGRSNRQRARWIAGKPVYHERCGQEIQRETKRRVWQRRAADPEFREQRRKDARERRRVR